MTTVLPRLALSVRQPWAWAILYAGKDIENRSWRHPNPGLQFRGQVCLHAAKGLTRAEYDDARQAIAHIGGSCPAAADLQRGGIIGLVDIVDVVKDSNSPWFAGPRGLVLANPQFVPFIPAVGQLGFFEWAPADASIVPAPAKWMLPQVEQPRPAQGSLL